MRNSSSDYPIQNIHTHSIEQTMEELLEKKGENKNRLNASSRPALPANTSNESPQPSQGDSHEAAPEHRPERSLLRDLDTCPPALFSEEHRCCHLKDYPSDPLFDWIEWEEDEFQRLRLKIRQPDPLSLFVLLKNINIEATYLDRNHTFLTKNRAEGIGDNEGVVRSAGVNLAPEPLQEGESSRGNGMALRNDFSEE